MRLSFSALKTFAVSTFVSAATLATAAEWKPVNTLLVVGNSITHHTPSSKLGWEGNWGMAASSVDKDYVHQFLARIAAAQGKSPELLIHAKGGGTIPGQLANASTLTASAAKADLIVVQLGENDRDVSIAGFQKPYDELLRLLRQASPSARILCIGAWAPPNGNELKDRFIRELCEKHGLAFADLTAANKDPRNKAESSGLWTHRGVNWHPGDAGMTAYADALWGALAHSTVPKGAPLPMTAAAVTPTLPTKPAKSAPATPSPAPADGVLFQESFAGEESLTRWGPKIGALTREGPSGVGALKIVAASATGSAMMRRSLPAAEFVGRTVTVTARIKTDGLSIPPKPWNGVKVMLTLHNAEGERDHPQAKIPAEANLPWTEISFTRLIPDNTVDIDLIVGLEKVTGTLWVTDIKIIVAP